MKIIYCAGGNYQLSKIAFESGFYYGARLPNTLPEGIPLWFADQDWKKPDRHLYIDSVRSNRPRVASVLDLEREDQFDQVMDWALEISEYVDDVMIIPKLRNSVSRLPTTIGSAGVILGYSVPTSFGATDVPYWQFEGRRVHFLGGSPHKQMHLHGCVNRIADVVSADGNMFMKMATKFNKYWENCRWCKLPSEFEQDRVNISFKRSCDNIIRAWENVLESGLEKSTKLRI